MALVSNRVFNSKEPKMNTFKLTLLQYAASRFLIINQLNNHHAVIVAVCGAGKTEMCFPLISKLIATDKVAFAIPRIDICNDIYLRLIAYYGPEQVGIHTGQRKLNSDANLLVLTTNQLLKYHHYFKLIIIDEVDAFPFDNNPQFYDGVQGSSNQGTIFYLTSTPSTRLLAMNLPQFTIYKRWHNLPLPVPILIHCHKSLQLTRKIHKLITCRKRNLLIFVSTITRGKIFSEILEQANINHQLTYSSHPHRDDILNHFKDSKSNILITTTILERGVTFNDIDVLIIDSDSSFYNKAALVQIAGRARRKLNYQNGNVYFVYSRYTITIRDSIKFIKQNNKLI